MFMLAGNSCRDSDQSERDGGREKMKSMTETDVRD